MIKKTIFIFFLTVSWFVIIGLKSSGELKLPSDKINKTIRKRLGDFSFDLISVDSESVIYPTLLYRIVADNSTSGYVYVSRLNSCRAGGCDANPMMQNAEFEYFDYFFVTDSTGKIINVKIFNYQATHGHQVMSRGWLKQFIGFQGYQSLNYGTDIQAVSGATISAKAIIGDIQDAEKLILGFINR